MTKRRMIAGRLPEKSLISGFRFVRLKLAYLAADDSYNVQSCMSTNSRLLKAMVGCRTGFGLL